MSKITNEPKNKFVLIEAVRGQLEQTALSGFIFFATKQAKEVLIGGMSEAPL